jgi:predicted AAA+ superfamily ATPase
MLRDAAAGERGAPPAKSTTIPYRRVLEQLWIVEPVPGWIPSRNHLRRLATAPKHQLVDPALALRMLGGDSSALLEETSTGSVATRDGSLLGALFESLATLCVRVAAQAAEARVFHLRQHSGRHEVDLIVERRDRRVVAIEVKLARAVDDGDCEHLRWLAGELGDDLLDAVILTTGPEAYRRRDGIAVVPLALLA